MTPRTENRIICWATIAAYVVTWIMWIASAKAAPVPARSGSDIEKLIRSGATEIIVDRPRGTEVNVSARMPLLLGDGTPVGTLAQGTWLVNPDCKSDGSLHFCGDISQYRIAKGRDAALSRRVPLERRVGRQNVTTE